MVGIDDHQYSDEALQWLFERFVDDGDEIVCVRVVEKDVRVFEADKRLDEFQREANAEVARIQAKCGEKKAVSIVLEYAVGKLHLAFQRLVSSCPTLVCASGFAQRTRHMSVPANLSCRTDPASPAVHVDRRHPR